MPAIFYKRVQPSRILKTQMVFSLRGKAYKPLAFSFLLNQETDGGDIDAL